MKLAGDFNNLSLIRGDVFQGRYKSIGFVFVLLSDSMSFVVAGRNYSFCFLLSRCPSSYGEFAVPKTLKKEATAFEVALKIYTSESRFWLFRL